MITLLSSVPGGGKTSYAVWHEIKREVEAGRVVYTCGIPNLKIQTIKVTHAQLRKWHERVKVGDQDLPDEESVFELVNFKEGSLIVIDEVYDLWPVVGRGTSTEDVTYLRRHRKHGLDFFLMTQRPNYVNADVLGLVERHLHILPDWIGRKLYEWTEYRANPSLKTNKLEAVKIPYKVPKESYDLYHSASIHIKPKKRTPIQFYLAVLAILAAPVGLYYATQKVMARSAPQAAVEVAEAASVLPVPVVAPVAPSVPVPVPSKPALMPVQLLTPTIDWKIVSACLQNDSSCICYGKSAERLVVPKESCELAVKHGWAQS